LRQTRNWLLGFSLVSLLTTVPGLYFRTHYFLLTLPALALLAGCAVSGAGEWLRRKEGAARFSRWPGIVYALLVVASIGITSDAWSVFAKHGGHALYGPEPFPEAETVAKFIRENSPPDTKIAVLGSEPEIYFLSRRHSATGYIYTYPLMEPQPFAGAMQRAMINEIETNAPELIVYVNQNLSWMRTPSSDETIFKWWNQYQTNYYLVGLMEEHFPHPSLFFWGTDAARHGKGHDEGLEVYLRKDSSPAPGTLLQK
jgi:hypothetical protein